jgi:quinol-cytochrome oxidoreductase complex cytochrome b subunit
LKALYTATSVIEAGAGIALLCFPSTAAQLLLGAPLEAPAALTVARVGGAALLTLGVAAWLARSDRQSPASRGFITAMVLYNLAAAFILGGAGVGSQQVGIALWPAVVLHAAMTVWCVVSLYQTHTAMRSKP